MKHLLSIDQLSAVEIEEIFALSARLKRERGNHSEQPLKGQTWALIFSKSSTRKRRTTLTGSAGYSCIS